MSDINAPIIAAKAPTKVDLEAGKDYYWCKCGKSASQPFCDGSHAGTDITPLKFTAEKTQTAALCQCKSSANAPFCDGTHATLGTLKVGDPAPKPKPTNAAPTATPTPEEPTVARIHELARDGLSKLGHHGEMGSMGVPRKDLPHWDDIQVLPAQMARKPLLDDHAVSTSVIIGPRAAKPLQLDIPLFVSDMSYGALSEEAKVALARGAELAGTGICSGEGGMLAEEQAENSRYFYELASAQFGWKPELVDRVQAFHFKGGQGAKTGTGGHLPGDKVQGKIAEVRGLQPGEAAISPSTFKDLVTPADFRKLADEVRERSGGIPIGFKLSANHIEDDIDFALEASADYIILDGRGGGTGAAPLIFRNHISVPTIPALARARKHLDAKTGRDVTLVITGGLRVAEDFVKAIAMGADAVAVSNSAMQAVGCIAARMCNSNNCPVGVATQKPELRARLHVQTSAEKLARYFGASVELMQVLARACGHDNILDLSPRDITTWKREMADLSGIRYAGMARLKRPQRISDEGTLSLNKFSYPSYPTGNGYLTESTRDKYISSAIAKNILPENAHRIAEVVSLSAPNDEAKPIQFWQLYSVLGQDRIVRIVANFYMRVFKDEDWFRTTFERVGPVNHHINTQAAMWLDVMGAGPYYHGGDFRLNFHHTHNAIKLMNEKGAKRWVKLMVETLNDSEDQMTSDARVRVSVNTFLSYFLGKYADEFNFETNETFGKTNSPYKRKINFMNMTIEAVEALSEAELRDGLVGRGIDVSPFRDKRDLVNKALSL